MVETRTSHFHSKGHSDCPLCLAPRSDPFHRDKSRLYLRCSVCDLVFVHSDHLLSRENEYERYELHNNDSGDPRYRAFLEKLLIPLNERIQPGSFGLDFGSGPTPLLKTMFEELGHKVSIYDVFYAPDMAVFNRQYDFISSSEVVEHLHKPNEALHLLWASLKPGGVLGIMTALLKEEIDFSSWYYASDPTHVIFFSHLSFEWLAKEWGASLSFINDSVVLLEKSPPDEQNGITF